MFATMLVLGLIVGWAVTAALVEFRHDGYRRTPTRAH
jgi:hypothetical protein